MVGDRGIRFDRRLGLAATALVAVMCLPSSATSTGMNRRGQAQPRADAAKQPASQGQGADSAKQSASADSAKQSASQETPLQPASPGQGTQAPLRFAQEAEWAVRGALVLFGFGTAMFLVALLRSMQRGGRVELENHWGGFGGGLGGWRISAALVYLIGLLVFGGSFGSTMWMLVKNASPAKDTPSQGIKPPPSDSAQAEQADK